MDIPLSRAPTALRVTPFWYDLHRSWMRIHWKIRNDHYARMVSRNVSRCRSSAGIPDLIQKGLDMKIHVTVPPGHMYYLIPEPCGSFLFAYSPSSYFFHALRCFSLSPLSFPASIIYCSQSGNQKWWVLELELWIRSFQNCNLRLRLIG